MSGRRQQQQQQQDSRLISEMKEQLKRLQERRQELESRQLDDDQDVLHQPIVPHLARVMRDRQWAQVRSMVQRNMDSIDHDIQEAIGRLGAAMLQEPVVDPLSSGRSPRRHFPDLIPSSIPPPSSPSRKVLLESVKEALLQKKKKPVELQEEEDVISSRIGFYEFRHETGQQQQEDKLSRLSVQKLPSVTITAPTRTADRPLNHVISVQSSSIVAAASPAPSEPTSRNELLNIKPDDVARLVSDILATEMELAVDSLRPTNAGCWITEDQRDNGDEFRLTIDSCTQTTIRSVKDSSTMMMAEGWHQTDRAVGPDLPISPEPDPEEIIEEESLTPPRPCINIAPDPTPPALDLDLWRRLFPPTPPSASSCSESLISQVAATTFHESSSSSDATGISSTISSDSTVDNTATAQQLSCLSEGQVPNRVTSPGQITIHRSAAAAVYMDRSTTTLSEGQIPLIEILSNGDVQQNGSSEGEIVLPHTTSRSDSTASFLSATGSLGEIIIPPSNSTSESE